MATASPAKGKSPVGLVVLVLILLLIVAGLAASYFMHSFNLPVSLSGVSGIPGVPGLAPRVTEADFAFIDDAILRKHMAAQANATSFRMKSHDIIGTKGSYNVFEAVMNGGDIAYYNWHETDGKKADELISIGDTTYLKDYKANTWWKQVSKPDAKPTGKDEPVTEPTDFKTEYESLKSKSPKFEKMGEETCGSSAGSGLQCYKYKEVDTETPEASRIFWFDTNKYLLRREESGFGEWRATVEYEYENINVKAPSPTKDVPEGKNIYEYMSGVPPVTGNSGQTEPSSRVQYTQPANDPQTQVTQVDPYDYTPPAEDTPVDTNSDSNY